MAKTKTARKVAASGGVSLSTPSTRITRPLTWHDGRLQLTLALSDYDHTRDFTSGEIRAEGIDITYLKLSVEEIFFRFNKYQEWDISEMSMAKYAARRSVGDDSFIGIPVFPSRVFRHSSIYVRNKGSVKTPEDLKGKRVGLPEWAQTAAVYSRGVLMHDYGLKLQDIHWFQAGVDEPGRVEKVALKLPKGIEITRVADDSLDNMLLTGKLDAVLSAHPPASFEAGDPRTRRLFENFQAVEADYYRRKSILPIMHVVAIRREVMERAPWVAMNLLKAFEEAKRRSVARMADMTASRVPIPWSPDAVAKAKAVFGEELWPYGVEANRKTLEAFLQYAYEQGVCHRRLGLDELFASQVYERFRV